MHMPISQNMPFRSEKVYIIVIKGVLWDMDLVYYMGFGLLDSIA